MNGTGCIQAIVADLPEALGEDVEEEPSHNLGAFEAAGSGLGAEGDLVVGDARDARVGDGHTMEVAGEVLERMAYGSVARGLDVHTPLLVSLGDEAQGAVEAHALADVEVTGLHGVDEPLQQPAPVHPGDDLGGKQEVGAGTDPALAVERQPPGGHEQVPVRVHAEVAGPGVEDRSDAEPRVERLKTRARYGSTPWRASNASA